MSAAPVVVVGGGLAGVAAAVALADAGQRVVLLESRPRLGGRAGSGVREGRPVDTGVHVVLRCYERYYALLDRLGVAGRVPLQDRLAVPVLLGEGRRARIARSRGPAPLPLLAALARYAGLSPAERVRAVAAAAALWRLDPDDAATGAVALGTWLAGHGQDEQAVRRLWGLLTVPALNLPVADASLALAAMVLRTALLGRADAADIGVPAVPLSDVHDQPARAALDRLGVEVRLGWRAQAVRRDGEGHAPDPEGGALVVAARAGAGGGLEQVRASALVVAVPHEEAARLVPAQACPDAARWARLGSSPIVNVHVLLDRPVLPVPFAAAPESPVQWLFDRTAALGRERGQYLVASLSAADAVVSRPAGEVLASQLAALRDLLPAARRAEVLEAFVTREPRATFRQGAGSGDHRPAAATRWADLALAGSWTATGWPDTLEGAVRSGESAARRLLAHLVGRRATAAARATLGATAGAATGDDTARETTGALP